MDYLTFILTFIFGMVIGSFLNVVAIRFNTGSDLGGRSKCMSCGKGLTWLELIPIFSFLMQKGSCKKCQSKISWQYPLVEFVAGAIFVLIFIYFPPSSLLTAFETFVQMIIFCLLLVISVYDIKHKIIPDRFSFTFSAIAFVNLFIGGTSWWHVPGIYTILAGPILALPFALMWLISRGQWMGLGDAKLALGVGWLLGISAGINAIILSFWIAAAVSLLWIALIKKKYKAKTEIPFGPYIILGTYLVLFFHIQVLDVHLSLEIIRSYLL